MPQGGIWDVHEAGVAGHGHRRRLRCATEPAGALSITLNISMAIGGDPWPAGAPSLAHRRCGTCSSRRIHALVQRQLCSASALAESHATVPRTL